MNSRHPRATPARPPAVPMHRGPQASMGGGAPAFHNAPNAALLIDFDNVTMGIRSDLQTELRHLLSSDIVKGKIAIQRAYADWRRYPQYVLPLTESSIDLIYAPAYGSAKKNATDIRLAIDAMELVFTRPEIGTFILLSGDSDFSSLVIKLKEYGKYVIGVGIRESSSDLLVMNCDEYYSYDALAGLVKTGEEESKKRDPWDLVTEAVTRMKRNGDVMRSDRLKQVMQEMDNTFDEKDLGHPKFSRFCLEAAQRGLLSVNKLENGQLEVDVPHERPAAPEPQRRSARGAAPPRDPSPPPAEDETTAPGAAEDRSRRSRRGRGRGRGSTGRDRSESGRPDAARPQPSLPQHVTNEFPVVEQSDDMASAARAGSDERPPRGESRPSAVAAAEPLEAVPPQTRSDGIGVSGIRLTQKEAFDIVKRAVESLTRNPDDSVRASDVRVRARELLGRDSETLAEHYFGRILRDAHDADVIDLRRRGNDFEVARAAEAAPVAEQLSKGQANMAAPQGAPTPAAAPRGMGPRLGGSRARGSFGARTGAPPADLLSIGVVDVPGMSTPSTRSAPPPAPVLQTELPIEPSPGSTENAEESPPAPAAKRAGRTRPGVSRGRAAKKAAATRAAETPTEPKRRKSRPRKTAPKDEEE